MSRPALFATQVTATAGERPFSLVWGVVVPGFILACLVVFTWLLYEHFSTGGG